MDKTIRANLVSHMVYIPQSTDAQSELQQGREVVYIKSKQISRFRSILLIKNDYELRRPRYIS